MDSCREIFCRCAICSRRTHSWVTFITMAIAIRWQSSDSRNHHQGMLEETNTSLQKFPGLVVVTTGTGARDITRSVRFRQNTRCAGSSSCSSLRRGPAPRPVFVFAVMSPGPLFINTRQTMEKIEPHYNPATLQNGLGTALLITCVTSAVALCPVTPKTRP